MTDPAAQAGPVGVLVVDDQRVFREVAREVIEATANFELLGVAECGEGGVTAAAVLHPDLVLLDVRMPGMDGVETAAAVARRLPVVRRRAHLRRGGARPSGRHGRLRSGGAGAQAGLRASASAPGVERARPLDCPAERRRAVASSRREGLTWHTTPRRERQDAGTPPGSAWASLVLACLLSAGAVAIVASDAAPGDRALSACVHVASILLPVAVGLARLCAPSATTASRGCSSRSASAGPS